MSASKYADLPDIDTAPDVYETEDAEPLAQTVHGDSSDDESGLATRSRFKPEANNREELDFSNLIGPEEASKKFRRAEGQRARTKAYYTYPPSPTSPSSRHDPERPIPLSHRLRSLQNELQALENEMADPSNPLLEKEREEDNVDPGELFRGLVDVRTRLEKIKKGKEGRARLVGAVLGDDKPGPVTKEAQPKETGAASKTQPKSEIQIMVDLDQRVGELEHVVGSSSTTLDDTTPLPTPLLPLITRLNNQLTILTQPRHVDSISRRLKLLLSDLERASIAQHQAHKRHPSLQQQQQQQQNAAPHPPAVYEQVLPLLTRLAPLLPQIPHVLTRLRTLSALHTSAAAFQTTLEDLEEEQRKTRNSLLELEQAVRTVENNLQENKDVVKNNITGLEGRVNSLLSRLEDLTIEQSTSF